MKNIFSIICLCTLVFSIQAQTLKGKVVTQNSQDPLPFVNISVLNTEEGTVTNMEGEFEINYKSENDSVEFSFLGYKVNVMTFGEAKFLDVIELVEESESLDELVLTMEPDVNTIIRKMLDSLKVNYPDEGSIKTGYIKETGRENGKLKRLIESGIQMYVPNYYSNTNDNQIKLLNVKKNVSGKQEFIVSGNFNTITTAFQLTKNMRPIKENLDNFKFEKIGKKTLNDRTVYEIGFSTKSPITSNKSQKHYDGKMIIDRKTYALVEIESKISYYKNAIKGSVKKAGKIQPLVKQLTEQHSKITFKPINEKWYLNYATSKNILLFRLGDPKDRYRRGVKKYEYVVEDTFVSTDIAVKGVRPFREGEIIDSRKPIYKQKGIADRDIWNDINSVKYSKEEQEFLDKNTN